MLRCHFTHHIAIPSSKTPALYLYGTDLCCMLATVERAELIRAAILAPEPGFPTWQGHSCCLLLNRKPALQALETARNHVSPRSEKTICEWKRISLYEDYYLRATDVLVLPSSLFREFVLPRDQTFCFYLIYSSVFFFLFVSVLVDVFQGSFGSGFCFVYFNKTLS